MYSIFAASVLITSALASPLSTSHLAQPRTNSLPDLAPLLSSTVPEAHIPNSYIVVLKKDADLMAHASFVENTHSDDPLQDLNGGGLNHVYDGNLKGYSGAFSENTIEKIRSLSDVDYIERDQIVWASELEKGAPWVSFWRSPSIERHPTTHDSLSHFDRVLPVSLTARNLALALSTKYVFHFWPLKSVTITIPDIPPPQYVYEKDGGEGVDAYVIDTGINIHHAEFEGRASWGRTVPKNDEDEDANGHGTHCAGTIASRKYGVAKSAHVIAVKVLGYVC